MRNASETFQPQITRKARNYSRSKPVGDDLYEEAQRRQQRADSKLKDSVVLPSKTINQSSEKMVVQKFNREFG